MSILPISAPREFGTEVTLLIRIRDTLGVNLIVFRTGTRGFLPQFSSFIIHDHPTLRYVTYSGDK
jgi:hypothetical protein